MIATANILQERHGIMSNKGFFSRKIWNAVLDRVPFFLLKMGQPRQLLSFIFGLFKETSLQFFTTNICGKCPSSIRCQDSNPQPSERESLPITTKSLSVLTLQASLLFYLSPTRQDLFASTGDRARCVYDENCL